MFVLATMAAASASGPIKIRNMSLSGALLEGGALPAVGEHLSLRRGELAVSGHVVWRQQGKAGLSFDCAVEVVDWLPAGSGGQQQVDRTFQELKTDPAPAHPVSCSPAEPSAIGKPDLLKLAEGLDILANILAEDARIIAAHSSKLQVLDAASQMLRRCADFAVLPSSHPRGVPVSASRPF
jgi:hypothetical protein